MSWQEIVDLAGSLGPLTNVLTILGLSGGSVYAFMRNRFRRQEVINDNLEKALNLRKKEIKDLKKEIDILSQYDPHAWLELAERERKNGNEEKAIAVVRSGATLTSDALYEAYLTLARHHVAIYPDQGESLHLQEAERFAHIAVLLKFDKVAASLLEEISETIAMQNIYRGHYNLDNRYEPNDIRGLYGSDLGAEVVNRLITVSIEHQQAGQYTIMERLTHRARTIALRELGEGSEYTLTARFWWSLALDYNGYFAVAKSEVDELLPLREKVNGAHHSDTQATRHLQAHILNNLNRYPEALEKVDELLPLMEKVNGAHHSDTLVTRHLQAKILANLNRYPEALEKVDELLPLMEKVNGAHHSDTLATRHLQALILDSLERDQRGAGESQ